MRQLDVTRTALRLSETRADTVLLITMPTQGVGHDEGFSALVGTHFGQASMMPLDTTGSITLIAQDVDDLEDMRAFMADMLNVRARKPRSEYTATMFSQGLVVHHVSGLAAPWPLGVEPEIARWRATVAAKAA